MSRPCSRCTGYRPILDAFRTFAKTDPKAYSEEAIAAAKGLAPPSTESNGHANGHANGHTNGHANGGAKVCSTTGLPCDCTSFGTKGCGVADCCMVKKGCGNGAANGANGGHAEAAVKPTAEPIFPPELKKRAVGPLYVPGPKCEWYRPVSLAQLLALKATVPTAKLVVGNTEVGIEMKFKDAGYPTLVAVTHVPELNAVKYVHATTTCIIIIFVAFHPTMR